MGETVEAPSLVVDALESAGVDTVFTLVGAPITPILAACVKRGIRPIAVRHEQSAVLMAQAYGYVRGVAGVAIVAQGPAVSNAVTGIHVAWDNCWPVVVIGGASPLATRGRMDFQEAASVRVVEPITKSAVEVTRPERIAEVVGRAFWQATEGRPGPVYVGIPGDVIAGRVPVDDVVAFSAPGPAVPSADPAEIEKLAEGLAAAERPLIVIGKGVRWSAGAAGRIKQLLEALRIPFVASPMGRGFVPDDHRLCVGAARSFALANADFVLVVGARLNWMFRFGEAFAPTAVVAQIDVVADDLGRTRSIDLPIVGDVGVVLGQVLEMLEEGAKQRPTRQAVGWLDALDRETETNRQTMAGRLSGAGTAITAYRLMTELHDLLPRDSVITVDGEVTMSAARQVLPSHTGAARLNSGTSGCMGVGIPFAIGAKLARPAAVVVSINGDSAFGFNAMEMETALRHDVSVVFIVANNGGIAGRTIQDKMFPDHPEGVATYLPGIRYEKIMEAFGGHAEHVETIKDVRGAVRRALASDTATCINVDVDPDQGSTSRLY